MPDKQKGPSGLLEYLPSIYHEDEFVGQFLSAFEKVLLGRDDGIDIGSPGLEQTIGNIDSLFTPKAQPPELPGETPADFLTWLSGWVALTLRADLDELRQRDFIARAVSLYRLRGTKRGLEELIGIYTRLGVTIWEPSDALQIGAQSTVGVDTVLGGGTPHFFRILIRLATTDPQTIKNQVQVVTDIVNMEKPAHTHFILEYETPQLQIGDTSRVGVDTLLAPRHSI
jgi:phage tail-like protein